MTSENLYFKQTGENSLSNDFNYVCDVRQNLSHMDFNHFEIVTTSTPSSVEDFGTRLCDNAVSFKRSKFIVCVKQNMRRFT